jgi:hypothetical protein
VLFRVRIERTCLVRFDRIAEAYNATRPPGASLKRSDGARAAIAIGLETVERMLGLEPWVTPAAEPTEGGQK